MDVPSKKWVFQLGWVVKKFEVGKYKFQVGVGGKTCKCVLIRVETATKPIEIKHVEISTLVVLVTVFSISS